MLVKICGIKTKSAALAASKYGADFLGFNFVPGSNRKITPYDAQKIIRSLPKAKHPIIVGVFMNQSAYDVRQVLSKVKLSMLQFHGQETPKFCANFGLPYIKAFGVDEKSGVKSLAQQMAKYKAKYFMLDRKDRGSGSVIDLTKVNQLFKRFPIILAGGLTPENIKSILSKAGKIKAVDAAGGVEVQGKKSIKKIKDFIEKTKI